MYLCNTRARRQGKGTFAGSYKNSFCRNLQHTHTRTQCKQVEFVEGDDEDMSDLEDFEEGEFEFEEDGEQVMDDSGMCLSCLCVFVCVLPSFCSQYVCHFVCVCVCVCVCVRLCE